MNKHLIYKDDHFEQIASIDAKDIRCDTPQFCEEESNAIVVVFQH